MDAKIYLDFNDLPVEKRQFPSDKQTEVIEANCAYRVCDRGRNSLANPCTEHEQLEIEGQFAELWTPEIRNGLSWFTEWVPERYRLINNCDALNDVRNEVVRICQKIAGRIEIRTTSIPMVAGCSAQIDSIRTISTAFPFQLCFPVLFYRHGYIDAYGKRRSTDLACSVHFTFDMCSAVQDLNTAWYLHRMPYNSYLRTEHWKNVVHDFRLGRCALCGRSTDLNLHHNTYARRGFEYPTDLVTLCRTCHGRFHKFANTLS